MIGVEKSFANKKYSLFSSDEHSKMFNRFYFRPEIGFANFFATPRLAISIFIQSQISNVYAIEEEEGQNLLKGGVVFNLSIGIALIHRNNNCLGRLIRFN